jgi:ribonuclease R
MKKDLENKLIALINRPGYTPARFNILAKKLELKASELGPFKSLIKDLVRQGRIELSKKNEIRPLEPHGSVTGIFRKAGGGFGFVRPHSTGEEGMLPVTEIFIPERFVRNAISGDEVLVRILKSPQRGKLGPSGEIVRVLTRATNQFVGTYFERDGQGLVRVDGTVFAHSVFVGDPGAKGAKPNDKVVFEMLRFPSLEDRGEGVITEILGPRGQPGVDTLSVIRSLGLPDAFPEEVLEEARAAASQFNEKDLGGREDFTGWLTVTIDPVDARDFDDAVSLSIDPRSKHWMLGVHIADVGHFAPLGGALDREARRRGTSVYLPQKVIPMFPEIISNSLASLQQDKVRFCKSALIDLTPTGQKAHVRFANSAIKVTQRFAYEQVFAILQKHDEEKSGQLTVASGQETPTRSVSPDAKPPVAIPEVSPAILDMLLKMRDLALILHKRRIKRGALELNMPEIELTYDDQGRVSGGHFHKTDISHQMIEDFMLLANEVVAGHLDQAGVPFLRRVHPAPEPTKLKAFADFARILGYKMKKETDRFSLQRILQESADKPEAHAVHYALLRSLKQATYSPIKDDHYALASENYGHFTSPIRRYPDLTVHRLLDRLIKSSARLQADGTPYPAPAVGTRSNSARRVSKRDKGGNLQELIVLGDHCSKMERRAESAERELIKLKLLTYMSTRLGVELDAVITGVADYGFFGQAQTLPVEGLVHISTLPDDYYYYDDASRSLIGQRQKRRYRLGDKVKVKVVRVDLQRRLLDFRVVDTRS